MTPRTAAFISRGPASAGATGAAGAAAAPLPPLPPLPSAGRIERRPCVRVRAEGGGGGGWGGGSTYVSERVLVRVASASSACVRMRVGPDREAARGRRNHAPVREARTGGD